MLYYPTHIKYANPEEHGVSHEEVTFHADDGVALHGWYFKSPETKIPHAVLVFFHGNGENLTSHFATLVWLLPYGYDFFIFDYRGYGDSEGSPSPEGTVKDGMAALRYTHAREPKIPLIVFAQSLGGAVAVRSISELHGEIPLRFVALDSTFLSYEKAASSLLSQSWITWLFQPIAYLVLSDKWAPGDHITEISPTPLLVMHGDHDRTIDFTLGEDLFRRAKEPKEFWRIERGTHVDAFWRHNGIYRVKFLEKLTTILREPAVSSTK